MQFIGIYVWMRHAKNKQEAVNGEDVYAKRLNKKQWLILIPITLIAIVAYAFALSAINASAPRIDSAAVVLSIVAQILMLTRYTEQWLLWIAVNVLTISLWVITLITSGGNDWTFVAMWLAFLVNSVYGYFNWRKIANNSEEPEVKVMQLEKV
jgi:nicotinamide mononucleotide transporter